MATVDPERTLESAARRSVQVWLVVLVLALPATVMVNPVQAGQVASEEFLGALERGDLDRAARLVDAGVDVTCTAPTARRCSFSLPRRAT